MSKEITPTGQGADDSTTGKGQGDKSKRDAKKRAGYIAKLEKLLRVALHPAADPNERPLPAGLPRTSPTRSACGPNTTGW